MVVVSRYATADSNEPMSLGCELLSVQIPISENGFSLFGTQKPFSVTITWLGVWPEWAIRSRYSFIQRRKRLSKS